MHIGFRPSGGRGEYELVGGHAGQSAAGLESWTLQFRWPDGVVRDTLLWLESGDSGKPRLRSLATSRFQVGRLVAAVLLLPPPRREKRKAASTLPVLQAHEFIISKIGFGPETEFASPPDTVIADPNYVEIANSHHSEFINVISRWGRIRKICDNTQLFPQSVANILNQYQRIMQSGNPIDATLAKLADNLRVELGRIDSTYQHIFDPLPALERIAGILAPEDPPLPSPDQLAEEEAEVKARSAELYRLARARNSSARRFSVEVREAYRETCVFCGARLGGVKGVPSGIDAAHILAWSSYDLDMVSNGLALCKNHHWAFDAALMVPVFENGIYIVRFTRLAERFELSALQVLGSDRLTIPESWLPSDVNQRPSPKYLARLYKDVAIDF